MVRIRDPAEPVRSPLQVFLDQSDRSRFKSLVLLGDEAREVRSLAIRILTTEAAVLERDLTAMDVVTESEAAKGKTPLAFPEIDTVS
jgi:hypothetical protein